jgi:hypothetical protein
MALTHHINNSQSISLFRNEASWALDCVGVTYAHPQPSRERKILKVEIWVKNSAIAYLRLVLHFPSVSVLPKMAGILSALLAI